MNLKRIIYLNFTERYLSFIPKFLSKYASVWEDARSLFNYYVLRRRREYNLIPSGIGIFSTTACNGNCCFCANRYLKDNRMNMPFDVFKRAVDEYARMGGKSISLTPSPGEVMLDPNFFEKVSYIHKKGMTCSLFTNALLFDKNIDNLIKYEIDDLHIDLADIVPRYDSRVFGISEESSKKRINAVIKFLEELEKRNMKRKVHLDFRPMRPINKIIIDMKKTPFWRMYKKRIFTMSFLQSYDNWGGLITKKDLLGIQTLKRPPKIKLYPCAALFTISILPDGKIRLCGCRCKRTLNDELVIGDFNKMSLKDLEKSEKWREIIINFQKGKLPEVCKDCSFYRPLI